MKVLLPEANHSIGVKKVASVKHHKLIRKDTLVLQPNDSTSEMPTLGALLPLFEQTEQEQKEQYWIKL